MSEVQRRNLPTGRAPKLVERSDAPAGTLPTITGYAAVFYRADDPGTEYEMFPADQYGPRVVERINPAAFARAVREDDVRGLFNHDAGTVLGRSGAGTLRLSADAVGLRYEIDPPDTQAARDLIASLRRGDISGSSFAFLPRNSKITKREEQGFVVEIVIERNDVQLFDVGPVTFPAYPGASSGVRSAGERDAVRREIERDAAGRDRDAVAVAVAVMSATLDDDE